MVGHREGDWQLIRHNVNDIVLDRFVGGNSIDSIVELGVRVVTEFMPQHWQPDSELTDERRERLSQDFITNFPAWATIQGFAAESAHQVVFLPLFEFWLSDLVRSLALIPFLKAAIPAAQSRKLQALILDELILQEFASFSDTQLVDDEEEPTAEDLAAAAAE